MTLSGAPDEELSPDKVSYAMPYKKV